MPDRLLAAALLYKSLSHFQSDLVCTTLLNTSLVKYKLRVSKTIFNTGYSSMKCSAHKLSNDVWVDQIGSHFYDIIAVTILLILLS